MEKARYHFIVADFLCATQHPVQPQSQLELRFSFVWLNSIWVFSKRSLSPICWILKFTLPFYVCLSLSGAAAALYSISKQTDLNIYLLERSVCMSTSTFNRRRWAHAAVPSIVYTIHTNCSLPRRAIDFFFFFKINKYRLLWKNMYLCCFLSSKASINSLSFDCV